MANKRDSDAEEVSIISKGVKLTEIFLVKVM